MKRYTSTQLADEASKLYTRIVGFKRRRKEQEIDMFLSADYPRGFAIKMVQRMSSIRTLSDTDADRVIHYMAQEAGYDVGTLYLKLANTYIKERVYEH